MVMFGVLNTADYQIADPSPAMRQSPTSQSRSIFTPSALSLPAAHIKAENPAKSCAFLATMPEGLRNCGLRIFQ